MLKILDELAAYVNNRAVSADCLINGTNYQVPIRRSILSGTTVTKHIYLTQNDPYGTVTRARLLGSDGKVIAERTDSQVHEQGKGLLIGFSSTIQEV